MTASVTPSRAIHRRQPSLSARSAAKKSGRSIDQHTRVPYLAADAGKARVVAVMMAVALVA